MTSASISVPSRPPRPARHRPPPSPRSRATLRRARWMRTRTAPSERPRTPGDLGGATSRRRSAGRAPGGGRPAGGRRRASAVRGLVAAGRRRPRGRAASADAVGRLERRLGPATRAARRRSATTLRAIWKSQTRNVDAPSPSSGRARSSNRRRRGERREERRVRWRPRRRGGRGARRGRSCTPGRGTSDTGRRTGPGPPGRLHERAVAVEVDDMRGVPTSSGRPTLLNTGRAIALHLASWRAGGQADVRGPRRRAPARSPVGAPRHPRRRSAPVAASTPSAAHDRGRAVRSGRVGRSRPVVTWRAAQPAASKPAAAQRLDPRPRGGRGTRRARAIAVDGRPPDGLAQATSSCRRVRREVGRAASRR